MTYPLTMTPYPLATIDGFFAKTNKAQGMNYLIKDADNACALLLDPNECALNQDDNSSFYMKDVSPTMKTISQRIFGSLPAAAEIIFSTDSYVDRLHSPKSAERDRRGCGETFIIEGLNIRRPVDWKAYLTNDENMKSCIHLLLEHWSSPSIMEEIARRSVISIEGGQAFKLACLGGLWSVEHLPEICSSHEETDVRIIIYIEYIQTAMSHIKTIRVRAKDPDIFFILLYFANSFTVDILMDTGEKSINISQLADKYSQEHIAALLALHAFTGADCTSAFKGKGKVRPMKLLSQNSKFINIFASVGLTWTLDDDHIVNGIEEFTCRLYGVGPRLKQVDVAREIKVKNICGSNVDLRPGLSIDLSTFQPCRRVLAQHIKRVNF